MKKLFLTIATTSLLFSCGETPLKSPDSIKKRKRDRVEVTNDSTSVKIDSIKHDTILKTDTVKVEKVNYKCKYPDMVSKILLEKRTQIFIKDQRDISFYSDAFLDVFDIQKTRPEILMYYDKLIDSALTKIVLRGKIDFNNINSGSDPVIK